MYISHPFHVRLIVLMHQILNEVNEVPVPVWAELGPAQPKLVSIYWSYKSYQILASSKLNPLKLYWNHSYQQDYIIIDINCVSDYIPFRSFQPHDEWWGCPGREEVRLGSTPIQTIIVAELKYHPASIPHSLDTSWGLEFHGREILCPWP